MVDGFTSEGLPSRLSSQRFYDDCYDFLQPGGVLVLNLHSGHPQCAQHVARVQRSFAGTVLAVDDGELSNTDVFACKAPSRGCARPCSTGRPHRPGAESLGQATRPNHSTDRPAASTDSSAPSAANTALISVSLRSTTMREDRLS